jgi:peptidoglycan/xylan/chitin deacetylase (PgdA/CDA1 family)
MSIPGSGRIKNAWTGFRDRFSARGLILLYHRVTRLESDPQRLAVSPENFERHLQSIREQALPVRLTDIMDALRAGRPGDPLRMALTFDDGYLDNLRQAKPLLEKYEIPATVFITTATIDHPYELWWDALERICMEGRPEKPLDLRMGEQTLRLDFSAEPDKAGDRSWTLYDKPASTRQQAYLDLSSRLYPLVPHRKKEIIAQLAEWAQVDETPRDQCRTMTGKELRELSQSRYVDIGAHTVHHPVLSGLDPDAQREEIVRSRILLEELLGVEVPTFSYPYGRVEDYNHTSVRIAREAGFQLACSNFPGLVSRWTDPFQLSRCIVQNVSSIHDKGRWAT